MRKIIGIFSLLIITLVNIFIIIFVGYMNFYPWLFFRILLIICCGLLFIIPIIIFHTIKIRIILNIYIFVFFIAMFFLKNLNTNRYSWEKHYYVPETKNHYYIKIINHFDEMDSEWFKTFYIYSFTIIPFKFKNIYIFNDPSGQEGKSYSELIEINGKMYIIINNTVNQNNPIFKAEIIQ